MSAPSDRRGFLRGLLALPLIGGGVTLIGQPSAVAEPVTADLLRQYVGFLAREYAHADAELMKMAPNDDRTLTWKQPIHHLAFANWPEIPAADALVRAAAPSTRAALVLSAVGADWREGAL